MSVLAAEPAPQRRRAAASPRVIGGFAPAMGLTLTWLSLIVLIPLAALAIRPWEAGVLGVWRTVSDLRVLDALRLSFGAALLAALVNGPAGLLIAWVLVRERFPGRRLLDAAVDLPFALPTAVAGIALSALYAPNGWIGKLFVPLGIKIAYTPTGVFIAMLFVGLPFVVRQVQPVLKDLDPEIEEAALLLGSGPLRRFATVVLPALTPALVTGFALAFARGVGEYGSVIFLAGNMPYKS